MSTLARRIVAVCLLAALACGAKATTAAAGTYPMSQCQALPSRPVAAGWASYGPGGMFNACGGDNGFGLWIGEMPYNSTAGLTIGIPSSRPHVAIERVDAGMNVTHERDQYSFLRWLAGGQTLYDREMTGWAESRITRTPAQGTREFTMDVVCTTGNGPTNCRFEDLRRVVVISWLVFTLAESDNPTAQATG